MPSIMTLEGHRQVGATFGPFAVDAIKTTSAMLPAATEAAKAPWWKVVAIGGGAVLAGFLTWRYLKVSPRLSLRGLGIDLKTIARESKSAEDYARRAEAWNHGLAPKLKVSADKLAKGFPGASASAMKRLLRDARQAREDGWAGIVHKSARGLRAVTARIPREGRNPSLFGVGVTEKQQRMFKRGVEAMKRAMRGASDVDRAFNVAVRGSKDPDFAAGVRNVWNRVSPHGNREAADKVLEKYGFKSAT